MAYKITRMVDTAPCGWVGASSIASLSLRTSPALVSDSVDQTRLAFVHAYNCITDEVVTSAGPPHTLLIDPHGYITFDHSLQGHGHSRYPTRPYLYDHIGTSPVLRRSIWTNHIFSCTGCGLHLCYSEVDFPIMHTWMI